MSSKNELEIQIKNLQYLNRKMAESIKQFKLPYGYNITDGGNYSDPSGAVSYVKLSFMGKHLGDHFTVEEATIAAIRHDAQLHNPEMNKVITQIEVLIDSIDSFLNHPSVTEDQKTAWDTITNSNLILRETIKGANKEKQNV